VALGVFTDAALAAEAHGLGVGASFVARFNRASTDEYSRPFSAEATVVALSDGVMVGRRGTAAGQTMNLGPSARLKLAGMDVIVISIRQQMLDPVQLEHFGIDIAKLRGLIIKSRGHFRAGFDEFFGSDQVLEVDVPGMVTPILTRIPFRNLKRPIFPFDPEMSWEPQIDRLKRTPQKSANVSAMRSRSAPSAKRSESRMRAFAASSEPAETHPCFRRSTSEPAKS